MLEGIYILIVVLAMNSSNGGIAVVQQEFSSREKCEVARAVVVNADRSFIFVKAQGCFKK